MINVNVIKVLGVATTVIGTGVTLVDNWLSSKAMDAKIEQKIIEALAKRDK